VHQGAATQGENQHPDEIPDHVLVGTNSQTPQPLNNTGKNYVVELFFRSCCFIFFRIELIIDVNAEPCSIMVAFHKRTGMLRVGSQPRTPE
jgi:hypothetical protein